MIAQRSEVPHWREHLYVIDQHGGTLQLAQRRVNHRIRQHGKRRDPAAYIAETARARAVMARWVDRYCRRHDLLQVNEPWVQMKYPSPGYQQPILCWKVQAVARDRRIDKAFPVGAKAMVSGNRRLLSVMARD